MKFPYEEFAFDGIRTYPLRSRRSKARLEDFARPFTPGSGAELSIQVTAMPWVPVEEVRILVNGEVVRTITELTGYADVRREVRYGENSRIDLLLSGPDRPDCYVEIKNVHLRRNGPAAEFPDSVTQRGAKHMAEMAAMVAAGHRAVVLFVVQRTDCDRFTLADDIDPNYAAAFDKAREAGVEALCYRCALSPQGIEIKQPLPIYRT